MGNGEIAWGSWQPNCKKNVGNARLGVWLDFAPQAMMRLLCRKGSDEICALGGLILTRWAAWSELGRSGVGGWE